MLNKLREANKKRHTEWLKEKPDLSFRGLELAGETGEACNEIKKLERFRLGAVGGKESIDDLIEELADVVICADLIAMDLNIDLNEAIKNKFNKTSMKNDLDTRIS